MRSRLSMIMRPGEGRSEAPSTATERGRRSGSRSIARRADARIGSAPMARPPHVAPGDVPAVRTAFQPFRDHPLLLGRHEIEQRVAAHVLEAMGPQQRFDLLPRPAAEEWSWSPIAAYSLLARAPPADPRRAPASNCPSRMTRRAPGRRTRIHSSIAASGCGSVQSTWRLMTRSKLPGENGSCSASASSSRIDHAALRRLAPRLGDHRGREVHAGDAMAPGRQLEAEKPGAAAGIERVQVAAPREDEIEDAVPGSALRGRADAVAEVLVEVRCPPIPVGGDLLLDRVCLT